MIEDSSKLLFELDLHKKKYNVWLSLTSRKMYMNNIYISAKDMDPVWFNIAYHSIDSRSNDTVPDELFYLKLFILYSCKQKGYLADLENIMGIDQLKAECLGKQPEAFYFDRLYTFINNNNYSYGMISPLVPLYLNGSIPSDFLLSVQSHSSEKNALYVLIRFIRASRKVPVLSRRIKLRIGKRISKKNTLNYLNAKGYKEIMNLSYASYSGCLFFSAKGADNKLYFIKSETPFGDSLSVEYNAARRLIPTGSELYLSPIVDMSSETCLVYLFKPQITLSDILKKRKLQEEELVLLGNFLLKVISDLYERKIIHRDITPNNIIVEMQNNIICNYKLIDFGVAAVDDQLPTNIKREKAINRTAGSNFRYSDTEWNDAMSSWLILLSSADVMTASVSELLDQLYDRKNTYFIKW